MTMEYERPSVEVINFCALQHLASYEEGGGFDSAQEGVGGTEPGGRPGRPGRAGGREE